MIERHRKAANERPVAITVRQIAEARNMSRMTASRAIAALVDKGFVVVIELGSYEGKRKPSRYRLTMFPCDGRDATHDYIEDVKEWRRQRGRRKPPTTLPPTVKVTWDIPTSHLVDVIDDVKKRLGEAAA